MSQAKPGMRERINNRWGKAEMRSGGYNLRVNVAKDPMRKLAHEIAMADPDRRPSEVKVFTAAERAAYQQQLLGRTR